MRILQGKSQMNIRGEKFKAAAFMFFAVSLFFLFPLFKDSFSAEKIKAFVSSSGILAPAAYMAALVFLPLIGVPRLILAATGGALFGSFSGVVYAAAGSTLAAVLAYHLAFYSAADYVGASAAPGGRLLAALDFSRENSFKLIVLARVCPIINCEAVNYLCGAAKISFAPFIAATLVGTIPGSIVYVSMGEAMMRMSLKGGISEAFKEISSLDKTAISHNADAMALVTTSVILFFFLLISLAGFYIVSKQRKNETKKEDTLSANL
ncbi:MAG TPA: VTT domain-containing protein [Candidatus Wallbacteria bacterium]|nr:VTT domain-containing protein [Candidatus Wallbacteria bacterium]